MRAIRAVQSRIACWRWRSGCWDDADVMTPLQFRTVCTKSGWIELEEALVQLRTGNSNAARRPSRVSGSLNCIVAVVSNLRWHVRVPIRRT